MTQSEKRWLWILKFIYKKNITKLMNETVEGRKEADKKNNRQLSRKLSHAIFTLENINDKLMSGEMSFNDIHLNEVDEEDDYRYISEDQHFRDMRK